MLTFSSFRPTKHPGVARNSSQPIRTDNVLEALDGVLSTRSSADGLSLVAISSSPDSRVQMKAGRGKLRRSMAMADSAVGQNSHSRERQFVLLMVKEEEEEKQKEQDDDEEEEVGLWGRLPQELLDIVLLKLPLLSHVRFRLVCKRWAKNLSSPEFLRSWTASARSRNPIFLYDIPPGLSLMDMPRMPNPSLFHICRLDLSFLQERVSDVWTASNGLICFHTQRGVQELGRITLCVTNPVTRTWKRLPAMAKLVQHSTRVAVALDPAPFTVVVLCSSTFSHDSNGRLCVYSSQTQAWTESRSPCLHHFPPIYRTALLVCGRLIYIYYLGQVLDLYNIRPDGHVSLVRSVNLRVPPGAHVEYHRLLEHHGRVFLVSRIDGRPPSFGIWELQLHQERQHEEEVSFLPGPHQEQQQQRWQEVSILPGPQWVDLFKLWYPVDVNRVDLMDAVSIGPSIFLSIGVYDSRRHAPTSYGKLLVFHTSSNSWAALHGVMPYPHGLLEPRWDLFI